ncbi:response regulator [uncultured Nisaea sp.]|uniref:sigma-54-dependent transcriptional regulator n=1 Tax=uncultured Nisaea sp. TaxID=538215 RepID=UPI0030EE732D|tara:strand:+ start:1090 stop:2307 length:1218 start_codon:yes stop_codon:yes gene_type:complete
MTGQVLLIEDDDALRHSLAQTLELADLTVIPAGGYVQAKRTIRANFPGVVLSDIRMPYQDGFSVLSAAQGADPGLPVILLTGHSDVPTAMRAMKEGAYEYLEKPVGTERLVDVVRRAIAHRDLVLKSRRIERALERSDAAARSFPGSGPVSTTLRKALRRVAASDCHVHLHGPKGTGKKEAAFAINALSPESRAFLTLNLLHAPADSVRRLQPPEGPADLSLKSVECATPEQIADLRALLSRCPELRVISSSVSSLAELEHLEPGAEGATVVEIRVPSLDERRDDLPEIFENFLRLAIRSLDADMPEVSTATLTGIMTRPWPGSLPELRSYAMTYALGARVQSDGAGQGTLAEQVEAFEKMVLTETLKRTNGKAAEAARMLGLPRNTLYDRLVRFGLSAKDFRIT